MLIEHDSLADTQLRFTGVLGTIKNRPCMLTTILSIDHVNQVFFSNIERLCKDSGMWERENNVKINVKDFSLVFPLLGFTNFGKDAYFVTRGMPGSYRVGATKNAYDVKLVPGNLDTNRKTLILMRSVTPTYVDLNQALDLVFSGIRNSCAVTASLCIIKKDSRSVYVFRDMLSIGTLDMSTSTLELEKINICYKEELKEAGITVKEL